MSGVGELIVFGTSIGAIRKTCDETKQILFWLEANNVKHTFVDLSIVPERRAEMTKLSGKKTLPQLFVDETYIGGYTEIEDWVENEELVQALQQAGVFMASSTPAKKK